MLTLFNSSTLEWTALVFAGVMLERGHYAVAMACVFVAVLCTWEPPHNADEDN
jgi:hypothetical protein